MKENTSRTSGLFVIINCFYNITSYLKTRSLENYAMRIKIGTVRTESQDKSVCVSLSFYYICMNTHRCTHQTCTNHTHTHLHMHTSTPHTYTHTHTGTSIHVYSHTCTHTLLFFIPLLCPFLDQPGKHTARLPTSPKGHPTLKALQTAFS